ncbi:hypothetical protein G6F57_020673 [Rhizopus arrhizus]|uniref:Uncharacterized protein n=1 Tax=Rhizopus oryzae TaxID=64495 RepID=A0A9P7BK61_RHIOR|nr:hypothetical protein G6F64_014058 [Rhizopus arrhizus]KAG1436424.1 hypothetical protein G6F57_020673 [Rhizopus arrhizus]
MWQSREQYSPIVALAASPARVARVPVGRQRVIGADHLVAETDIGAWTQEEGPIVGHVAKEVIRVARHDLHVLESQVVRYLQHLFDGVADNDLTALGPGLGCDAAGGQDGQLALDFGQRVARQCFAVGKQHGGRRGAVFRLA